MKNFHRISNKQHGCPFFWKHSVDMEVKLASYKTCNLQPSSQSLVNTVEDEKRFRLLSNYFGLCSYDLLWSLIIFVCVTKGYALKTNASEYPIIISYLHLVHAVNCVVLKPNYKNIE